MSKDNKEVYFEMGKIVGEKTIEGVKSLKNAGDYINDEVKFFFESAAWIYTFPTELRRTITGKSMVAKRCDLDPLGFVVGGLFGVFIPAIFTNGGYLVVPLITNTLSLGYEGVRGLYCLGKFGYNKYNELKESAQQRVDERHSKLEEVVEPTMDVDVK